MNLTELKEDLEKRINESATVTISDPTYSNTRITGGSYPNVTLGGGGAGLTYTSGTGTSPLWTTTASPWMGNGITADPYSSGKIKLNGEDADIEINGQSIVGLLKEISERLNILKPNEKMEAEWDQLRELGEQYRALEAKLKEQGEMWNKLKAMPPPEI